jgi:Glycine rich protein/Fibronectin type III domain
MLRMRAALILLGLIATFLTPLPTSAVVASNPNPDCSAGTTCTITFTYTGDYYQWTVPSGVTSVTVDLSGAQGGTSTEIYAPQAGGLGGRVTGTLQVTADQVLFIYVGEQPSAGAVSGGWNGGGAAGNSTAGGGGRGGPAGGGGGATDVRTSTSAANRILVAGGGGGGGRDYVNGGCQPCGVGGNGGNGGGTIGAAGSNSGASGYSYGTGGGGGGGTQSSGGTAGSGGKQGAVGLSSTGGAGASGSQDVAGGGGGGGYFGGGGGSTPGDGNGGGAGGGGGGSSYTSPTLASSVTHTQGYKSGNGSVAFTYLNSPIVTTFSTTQTSPTNISTSSTISYSLVMSQSVTGMAAADFQFGGTSGCNTPSVSGSGANYTVTVTNCTEGTVILQLKANSVTGTAAGPPTLSSANTVVIDRTAPTISSVSAPSNATYIPAGALNFTVNFSESVTVTSTPRLTLTVGALTKYASFVSLTDSKTATFRYTVATASGEFDTDGIAVSTTLDLNSGAIADLATNALSPLTFTAPTLTSVLVAQTPAAPTITSITPSSGTLSVAFTAGATNGSAITNYEFSTNNGANWTVRSPTATTSPISISGLTNGTAYNVRIRAVNAAGAGDSSTAVSATPSAVVVSGDATLTTTYGSAASTTTYTSVGGTSPYTYTLSATPSGVSISGGVVTASSSTTAGTYTQNVISTDSASQTGLKQLVITVNKASTTITIALPSNATEAALGGAITITATVSQAGAVNFKLGGSSISGCSAVTSAAGTATCSWTPGALGGASLTAVLTPTDSNNYESATTSTLSITVVNGVTSLSLSLAGGVTQAPKGQNIVITATVDQAGRISFFVDGKRIAGCFNKIVATSSRTCTWKPSVQKQVTISSRLVPTNSAYSTANESMKVWVVRRTGTR